MWLLEKKLELMKYRMDMAKERIDSARILLEHHNFKDSIGRSYYAMFTAVRAILALDGVDFKKHAGVISYFRGNTLRQVYLKSDIQNI
ncbi:HEPN domain-containing protein [uncultured Dialister sp.]|uniref:HEPN domain-containing protein n=1 Tax=uncultured Dialister sp. TaxID=278064 RepID=UPI002633025E|nr:HEPN domain-containing protein [uncultured Dialister sp.]